MNAASALSAALLEVVTNATDDAGRLAEGGAVGYVAATGRLDDVGGHRCGVFGEMKSDVATAAVCSVDEGDACTTQ